MRWKETQGQIQTLQFFFFKEKEGLALPSIKVYQSDFWYIGDGRDTLQNRKVWKRNFYGGSHQTRDLYLACMIESSSTGQIKASQQYAQCLRGKNMLGFERLKEKLELGEDEQFWYLR